MCLIPPTIASTCDWGHCDRQAVSTRYDPQAGNLLPVCRRHLLTYRVVNNTRWQAEDEAYQLRFARRSRSKTLAQWKLLLDQRAAMRGRTSLTQRWLTWRANRAHRIEVDGR